MPSPTPPSQAPSEPAESFQAMTDVVGAPGADLDALGAHCQLPYCHVLDFLPFKCLSCQGTFCLEHRSETAHKCNHAGEWARRRRQNSLKKNSDSLKTTASTPTVKPNVRTGRQCSHVQCKTLIHTLSDPGVHCTNCNRQYCLKHRLREDHDCSKLTPIGARPHSNAAAATAERARSAFARLRTLATPKPSAPKPQSRAAQIAAVNNMKKTAKGDDSLAPEKRLYLHVEAEAATTKSKLPRADLYFNRDWSVGRMLDEAAKRLQVLNINNRAGEEDRLRVYHVEGGRMLEFAEKIGSGISEGNTVVLLRGIGPGPDLVEP
ncbi:MAG: hypothetical protein Q9227_007880 [Pyrenula ochraceoflavens]